MVWDVTEKPRRGLSHNLRRSHYSFIAASSAQLIAARHAACLQAGPAAAALRAFRVVTGTATKSQQPPGARGAAEATPGG